ncbi:MAG: VWA domain-containing protein [Paludibacteraceae bacterium]|nr:VWA domain-containing protein [Paludibacteraceae bacterium]
MKKMCLALASGMMLAMSVNGQDVPKGLFEPASVYQKSVSEKSVLYQADANRMGADWSSVGFYSDGKNYKTGAYAANSNLSAVSGTIDLSKVAKGTRLFLKLRGAFETEYFYDRIGVSLSEDGGKNFSKVYSRTGKSNGTIVDYADLSQYAGKSVVLRLELKSDGAISGKGWSLSELSVVSEETAPMRRPAPGLRGGTSGLDMCSNLGGLNVLGVQWISDTEGIVAFTMKIKDDGGSDVFVTSEQFASNAFDLNDIHLFVNGNEAGCKEKWSPKQQMIDVVYMIDNSGSMEDEQNNVHAVMPKLIKNLGENYDARAALYRFGFNASCPFSLERDNMNMELMEAPSPNFNALWAKNGHDGSYEGYYAGMENIAQLQLAYRPLAQKVLIMMGDESALTSVNRVDCSNNVRTQADALSALMNAGFQTFVLQDDAFKVQYQDIVEKTGGDFGDVKSSDYSPIMAKIAEKVKTKLYMKFCTKNQISCQNKQVPVTMEICNKESSTITTVDYVGAINRTAETVALDKDGVTPLSPVTIAFEVEEVCKEISSVEVSYSYVNAIGETVHDTKDAKFNGSFYSMTIDQNLVNPNRIEYNIRVNYKDGTIAASSPIPNNVYDYSWTIPVKESVPPTIKEVVWTGAYASACGVKTVEALVEDEDGEIVDDENGGKKVYLFYEDYYPNKSDYKNYNKVQMTYNSATGKYEATLDSEVGSEKGFVYFIYAEDNEGLKGWFGDEKNYNENLYNEVPLSSTITTVTVSRTIECPYNFKNGDILVAYYEGCNGDLVEVGRHEINTTGGSLEYDLDLAIDGLNQQGIQNGLKDTDKIHFVLFRSLVSSSYWTELTTLESYDGIDWIEVCPPASISEFLTLEDENHLKIENGQTISFSPAPAQRAKMYTIINDSEDQTDWIVNSMKIEPSESFVVYPDTIKNKVIAYGDSLKFTVEYIGEENAEADLFIFNNTLTDPFTLHLKGEAIKECTDELQNIQVYNNSTNVGIRIEGNQSMIKLEVRDAEGQIRKEYEGFLGHGVQTMNVPTTANDTILRVDLTIDGEQCQKVISLMNPNGEVTQPVVQPTNTCEGLVQSLSVNTWGTMIGVDIQTLTNLQIDVLNVDGSSTGVKFGPQLMGAGLHNLYLGTNNLQSAGVHIVRVLTDGNVCSMPMVNVK